MIVGRRHTAKSILSHITSKHSHLNPETPLPSLHQVQNYIQLKEHLNKLI